MPFFIVTAVKTSNLTMGDVFMARKNCISLLAPDYPVLFAFSSRDACNKRHDRQSVIGERSGSYPDKHTAHMLTVSLGLQEYAT
jgi:hypothetical protein